MNYEELHKRMVDIHEYIPVMRDLIAQGKEVALTITGNSMSPFLAHGRDQILIEKPQDVLKKGDMVFYQRTTGAYVMHRICKADQEGAYWLVGDAQTMIEGPIYKEQIFGKIKAVRRKGKWIHPGSFWWEFFRTFWLWIVPIRPMLRKAYGIVVSIIRK